MVFGFNKILKFIYEIDNIFQMLSSKLNAVGEFTLNVSVD